MGRHKETYRAKWQAHRQMTIDDQGNIRIPLEVQIGDPGRPVVLSLTAQELESVLKSAREAVQRHSAEQLRREFSKREWEFRQQEWDMKRQLAARDGRIKELEGVIDRVHDVVHPDRSEVADLSDRPNVVHVGSNVAH